MPKDSKGSTGLSYIVDRKKKMDKVIFAEKRRKTNEIRISRN